MIRVLFWASVLMIIYVYFGYPILIYILSLFYKKPLGGKYIYPMVSILMSAYNEEKNIERKIQSLQSLDYPSERMEILIGSDGSTDRTDEIVSKYINGRFKLFRQQERQGKPSMLNLLVPQAKGEILVFTDARQILDTNALKEIVKHFADPRVGSVSAALFYEREGGNKTGSGVGLYWEYEKFIRKSESRMGSMLGATGALYAIRRELFPLLFKDLILDDVYIPMKIVEKGYRAIFDKKAKVYDKVFSNPRDEFLRRTRTLAGNYQLFFYLRELFNPFRGKISWQFFSHKFLRLIVPFLLILVFVSSIFLSNGGYVYRTILALQICFYCCAILGMVLKNRNKVFDIAYMFCVMNVAAIVGLYKIVANKQEVTWEKSLGD